MIADLIIVVRFVFSTFMRFASSFQLFGTNITPLEWWFFVAAALAIVYLIKKWIDMNSGGGSGST